VELDVKGQTVGAGTGGAVFDNAKPAVVFISGASLDHTVWAVPMRYFAQEGYGVLGPDMPGHGRSEGPPLATIEAMGGWLIDVLDAAGIETATLIGFSMGTYIALEAAARAPERVRKISLAGVADAMKVHPELLAAAEACDHRAFELMVDWCHGAVGHVGGQPAPGLWVLGNAMRLFERAAPGLLFTDLTACNDYTGALATAAKVTCPVQLIVGEMDMMTPPKGAARLAAELADVETVGFAGCGHMTIAERPNETLDALRAFVSAKRT
jgi:pimeloyl-ACP methyl ester carboxylesterase